MSHIEQWLVCETCNETGHEECSPPEGVERELARRVVHNNPTSILFQVRRVLEGESTWADFQEWMTSIEVSELKQMKRDLEARIIHNVS